jgi:hypothetical protein
LYFERSNEIDGKLIFEIATAGERVVFLRDCGTVTSPSGMHEVWVAKAHNVLH